jgi:hypothetical protein
MTFKYYENMTCNNFKAFSNLNYIPIDEITVLWYIITGFKH